MTRAARRAVLAAAATCGALTGIVVSTATGDLTAPPTAPATATSTAPPTAVANETSADPTPTADRPSTLLVWTSGGLPADLGERVAGLPGVVATTIVRGEERSLVASTDAAGHAVDQLEDGWTIPLDVLAIDPATFPGFVADEPEAATAIAHLSAGEALLGATSARIRRLGPGASIQLADGTVTITAVVDDHTVAGAELVVPIGDADRLGVTTPRYLLIAHTGDRVALQDAIAAGLHGRAARFRSPAETTWLRHGDAVEPAAVVKAAYGEFAIRDGQGRNVQLDPAWTTEAITTEDLPILGSVTCHRDVLPALRAAMGELEQANIAYLIDPADFAGCFSPRRIEAGQPLSHHAWGAAIDLNVDGNPRGSFSTQDPRLVEVLTRHGFSWGGDWLVPDPAHYELVPPLD